MVLKQVNNFRGSETKRKTNGSNIQITSEQIFTSVWTKQSHTKRLSKTKDIQLMTPSTLVMGQKVRQKGYRRASIFFIKGRRWLYTQLCGWLSGYEFTLYATMLFTSWMEVVKERRRTVSD